MSEHIYPTLVVVALIIRDDKVLLERRAPSGAAGMAAKWDLPGGKVEVGESGSAALIRELREELGITVVPLILIQDILPSVWEWPNKKAHWLLAAFVCAIAVGEPICSQNLQWLPYDMLSEDVVMQPDLDLIREFLAARRRTGWDVVPLAPMEPGKTYLVGSDGGAREVESE